MSQDTPPQMSDLPQPRIARRQLQLMLLLDCSGSMAGEKIASLNYAIRSAMAEVKTVAAENPEVDMRLSAICFSTGARWHIETPTPVADVSWEDVQAGGETAMGEALALAVDFFESEGFAGRQLPPVVLLVTDGYATDDFNAGFEAFMNHEAGRQATRIAVAIGDAADMNTLDEFVDRASTGIAPLCARSAPDLVNYIKWATTAPVKASSMAKNTPSGRDALAQDTEWLSKDCSEIVW